MPIFEGAFQNIVDFQSGDFVLVPLPGQGQAFFVGVNCDFDVNFGVTALRLHTRVKDPSTCLGADYTCDGFAAPRNLNIYSPNLSAGDDLLVPGSELDLGVTVPEGETLVDWSTYAITNPRSLYDFWKWAGNFVCQWDIQTSAVEARTNGRPYYYLDNDDRTSSDPGTELIPSTPIPTGQKLVMDSDVLFNSYAIGTVVAYGPNVRVNADQITKSSVNELLEEFLSSSDRPPGFPGPADRPPFLAVVRKKQAPAVVTAEGGSGIFGTHNVVEAAGPMESYDSFKSQTLSGALTRESFAVACSAEDDSFPPGLKTREYIDSVVVGGGVNMDGVEFVNWDSVYNGFQETISLPAFAYGGRIAAIGSSIQEFLKFRFEVSGFVSRDPLENLQRVVGTPVSRFTTVKQYIAARPITSGPFCYANVIESPFTTRAMADEHEEVEALTRSFTINDYPTRIATEGGFTYRMTPAYFLRTFQAFNNAETIFIMYKAEVIAYQGESVPPLTSEELSLITAAIP
jgi:hypothetical protein